MCRARMAMGGPHLERVHDGIGRIGSDSDCGKQEVCAEAMRYTTILGAVPLFIAEDVNPTAKGVVELDEMRKKGG